MRRKKKHGNRFLGEFSQNALDYTTERCVLYKGTGDSERGKNGKKKKGVERKTQSVTQQQQLVVGSSIFFFRVLFDKQKMLFLFAWKTNVPKTFTLIEQRCTMQRKPA